MARFNTLQSTISITTGTTLTFVINNVTLLLTGSPGYTVTLADPSAFVGTNQNIYNNTGGNVTIATAAGNIIGNGFVAATTQIIPNNTSYTLTSNGANYVVTNNQGGPISPTTGTFSGTLTTNGALNANGTLTTNASLLATSTVSLNPANANVTISPTGSGTVTIAPASTTTIGATGQSVAINGNITANAGNQTITLSPTGTGTVAISPTGALTINPVAASTINNTSIGATTAASGRFTTLALSSTLTANGANGTVGQVLTSNGAGAVTWRNEFSDTTQSYASSSRTVNGSGQITAYTVGSYAVSGITYSNTTSAASITAYTENEGGVIRNVAITYLANGMINTITVT
jgi:hypothetical protein